MLPIIVINVLIEYLVIIRGDVSPSFLLLIFTRKVKNR